MKNNDVQKNKILRQKAQTNEYLLNQIKNKQDLILLQKAQDKKISEKMIQIVFFIIYLP